MQPAHALTTALLIAISALGGWAAHFTLLPLPYMLGSLLISGLVAVTSGHRLPEAYAFPQNLRIAFIATIGMMIGARVTPDLISSLGQIALSLAAVTLFVVLAQGANYLIFHRIGGYDRTTAFFAGAPGGLIESITLGEAAGADIRQLVVQQFLRIIFVVAIVPIGISLWIGHPVGSASGISLSRSAASLTQLPLLLVTGAAGILLGRVLRLPAWQMTGPMIAAAGLSLSGLIALDVPQWLVNTAQIVIGTSLGMRFAGITRAVLARAVGLSFLSVCAMLAIGGALALAIYPFAEQPYDVLLISFAPGGVTEMALVALSLHANPAFVTILHIYRITVTVVLLSVGAKRLRP